MSHETDDLLTDEEKAYAEQGDDYLKGEEVEITASEDDEDGANDEAPIVEPTPESDDAPADDEVEEKQPAEPFITEGRYADVVMTDTVPPELAAQLDELARRFDESEIDITEFLKIRAVIDRQVTSYQILEANQQRQYNSWMDAQDNFFTDHREYVDNDIMYGALDTAVKKVNADPRSKGLTPAEVMRAADYLVKDSFGMSVEPRQQAPRQATQRATNTLPNLQTLGNIPTSAQNDTGSDPFSAIDRLQGDAREAALGKLSPEQYDAYLRG
jgi:hypothetical protein